MSDCIASLNETRSERLTPLGALPAMRIRPFVWRCIGNMTARTAHTQQRTISVRSSCESRVASPPLAPLPSRMSSAGWQMKQSILPTSSSTFCSATCECERRQHT